MGGRIYQFEPAPFQRMYFIADNITHASLLGPALFDNYYEGHVEPYSAGDAEEIAEDRAKARAVFDAGFSTLEEAALCFVDTAY
jgi:hypothetical protein